MGEAWQQASQVQALAPLLALVPPELPPAPIEGELPRIADEAAPHHTDREKAGSDSAASSDYWPTDSKTWLLITIGLWGAGAAALWLLWGTRAFAIFLTQTIATQFDPIAVIGPIIVGVLQRNYLIAMAFAFGWAYIMEGLFSSLGQGIGRTYPFGHLLFQRAVGAMLLAGLVFGIACLIRRQRAQS